VSPARTANTGIFFREHRKQLGLNQKQVARAVGVSQNMVSRWENDKDRPAGNHLRALLGVLEIDPGDYAKVVYDNGIAEAVHRVAAAIERIGNRLGTALLVVVLGAGLAVQAVDVVVDPLRL
jgi:transcriptional regulator with XRE-family HTH domain